MAPVDAPGVLDQKAVVDAACRLAERVGAKTLTMRMLADELGVSAMAAYRHVPSKKALLVLIADSVMSRVEVPPPSSGPWDARLELLEQSAFAELAKFAELWDLVPFDTVYPNRLRLVDAVVGILLEAGFDPRTAALAHETFFGYVAGQLKMGGLLTSSHLRRGDPSQPGQTGPLHLGDVQVEGREEWIGVGEYFTFGLRVLLNGLREELRRMGRDGRASGTGADHAARADDADRRAFAP